MTPFSEVNISQPRINLCALGPSIKRLKDADKTEAQEAFNIGVNWFDAWDCDIRSFVDRRQQMLDELSGMPMTSLSRAKGDEITWDDDECNRDHDNKAVLATLKAIRYYHPTKDVVLYGVDLGADQSFQYGTYPDRERFYRDQLDLNQLIFRTIKGSKDVFFDGAMNGERFFSKVFAGPGACDGMPWIQKINSKELCYG